MAPELPVKPAAGVARTYFLYGRMDQPVNLWRFLADRDAVEQAPARGPEKTVPRATRTRTWAAPRRTTMGCSVGSSRGP